MLQNLTQTGDFMFAKVYDTEIKIDHNHVEGFNRYASDIMAEYNQSIEEGLDIEKHKALFESVAAMRSGEMKTKLSELIFETVIGLSPEITLTDTPLSLK